MLSLTRKLPTSLAVVLLGMSSALSLADETPTVPAQPSTVELVVVTEVQPSAATAEPLIAAAELASMIENEVLLDLNSRLIAAAPSS